MRAEASVGVLYLFHTIGIFDMIPLNVTERNCRSTLCDKSAAMVMKPVTPIAVESSNLLPAPCRVVRKLKSAK